jgi:hypothetical protein
VDEDGSFNPHWVGDVPCRDYRIGNIILTSVPDAFVLRVTKFRSPYEGVCVGHVLEFVEEVSLRVKFSADAVEWNGDEDS